MAHVQKFKASALGNMCAHYDRTPERERGYRRENIDSSVTPYNYNLAPERDLSQVEFINQRIESLNLKRLRKDAVRMCDWVITQPKDLPMSESRAFFKSCYSTLENMYGRENVVSAYVHLDESQPHMHFAFVPVTDDGRLSAKDVLNKNHLKGFHDALRASVEWDLGHEVGITLEDGEKAAEYVSLPEYKAAKEETDKAKERLELLRQEERGLAKEVKELESNTPTSIESARIIFENRDLTAEESRLRRECKELEKEERSLQVSNRKLGARFEKIKAKVTKLLKKLSFKEIDGALQDLTKACWKVMKEIWPDKYGHLFTGWDDYFDFELKKIMEEAEKPSIKESAVENRRVSYQPRLSELAENARDVADAINEPNRSRGYDDWER